MPQGDRETGSKGNKARRKAGRKEGRKDGHRAKDETQGHRGQDTTKTPTPPVHRPKMPLTPLKIRAIFFDKPFSMQLNLAKSWNWSRKSRGNTFCVQENVEKRGILGGMGVRGLVGGQMSEGSGQLKRGDLRAYLGVVEGLYPLEGEGRFTGISEGFTGKELEPCSCGKGLLPQGGPVSKKFAPKFFGGS